jgi:hypothetical protein
MKDHGRKTPSTTKPPGALGRENPPIVEDKPGPGALVAAVAADVEVALVVTESSIGSTSSTEEGMAT